MSHDEELEITRKVLDLLSEASASARTRIANALATLLHDDEAMTPVKSHRVPSEDLKSNSRELQRHRFSENRTLSPKEFMLEKKPSSDVERVSCLAYYLAHYRSQSEFKTPDISSLNLEAGQPRIGNATRATDNATRGGYLINSGRGLKQISALGEQIVQALPDRDKAREIYKSTVTRRRTVSKRTAKAKASRQRKK